jgi:predicted ATPase
MLIKRLSLKRILSFTDSTVELGPLNVLIGPNAVGKSNLIEIIGLLQAAPSNILSPIAKGGGPSQWVNLGRGLEGIGASIECEVEVPDHVNYRLQFYGTGRNGFSILDERLAAAVSDEVYFQRSHQELRVSPSNGSITGLLPSPHESFFSQFRDPFDRTPVSRVGRAFAQIRIYREFKTGQQSGARMGVSTQAPNEVLADGSDNLAMVLQEMDRRGSHEEIKRSLRRFCERFEDVKVGVRQGLASVYLQEEGLTDMIADARMSDGTLKFLSLLVVLLQPHEASLICIEEPEVGLHPDAMRIVADLLVEASQKVQIVVTSHSEAFVDAFSDTPDNVLVCERADDNGTQMQRPAGNFAAVSRKIQRPSTFC